MGFTFSAHQIYLIQIKITQHLQNNIVLLIAIFKKKHFFKKNLLDQQKFVLKI